MLLDDARDHLHLDMCIERAFRIHDHDRTAFAETEAAGADNKDFAVDALFLQFLFQFIRDLHGTGRCTSGTAAHQDMLLILGSVCFLTEAERHFLAHFLFDCSEFLQSLHSKPPNLQSRCQSAYFARISWTSLISPVSLP